MIDLSYRQVSPLAVAAAVMGFAAALGLLVPQLVVIAIPGMMLGIVAWRNLGYYEQGGGRLVRLALATSMLACVVTFIGVPVWQRVAFRMEAPEGYLRLDFKGLMQSSDQSLDAYLGENVCLKGYALPTQNRELTSFALTSNNDPQSNVYIIVDMPDNQTWTWSERPIAVSGTLVRKRLRKYDDGPLETCYIMQAHSVRPSQTKYQLSWRFAGDC